MKICPIALAAGCARCPIVAFCPLKTVLGDYRAPEAAPPPAAAAEPPPAQPPAKPAGKPGAAPRRRRKRPRG